MNRSNIENQRYYQTVLSDCSAGSAFYTAFIQCPFVHDVMNVYMFTAIPSEATGTVVYCQISPSITSTNEVAIQNKENTIGRIFTFLNNGRQQILGNLNFSFYKLAANPTLLTTGATSVILEFIRYDK